MLNHLTNETIKHYSTPHLIRIKKNIYAAKFDLMKFTPALKILQSAMATGQLKPGGKVIESSSGTFALALAIICSFMKLRLTLVTGPVSEIVRWRLEQLGANLTIVPTANNCEGGIQQARLDRLHQLIADDPNVFWTRQYSNELNANSYTSFAELIISELPNIDTLVASVGSGGSMCGTAKHLRLANNHLKVVGVDHNRSVLFGSEPRTITKFCHDTYEQLLAMGAGIVMDNLDHSQCDDVHWTPIPLMVQKVHEFHRTSGFLVGPSSGAALAVAEWEATQHPDKNILVILPDHGVRYVDTMFNPTWLSPWQEDLSRTFSSPKHCDHPQEVTDDWCQFHWNRAQFEMVHSRPPFNRPQGYNP